MMETIVPTKVLFYFALPKIFSTGVNQSITMSKNQFTKISQTRTDLLPIKFCPYFENISVQCIYFAPDFLWDFQEFFSMQDIREGAGEFLEDGCLRVCPIFQFIDGQPFYLLSSSEGLSNFNLLMVNPSSCFLAVRVCPIFQFIDVQPL